MVVISDLMLKLYFFTLKHCKLYNRLFPYKTIKSSVESNVAWFQLRSQSSSLLNVYHYENEFFYINGSMQ